MKNRSGCTAERPKRTGNRVTSLLGVKEELNETVGYSHSRGVLFVNLYCAWTDPFYRGGEQSYYQVGEAKPGR